MDKNIDLEHIKSLKELSRDDGWEYGKPIRRHFGESLSSVSTEDPEIFMVWLHVREEDLTSYILIIEQRSFSFCIRDDVKSTLKQYESDGLKNTWIDEILCDVVDYSPSAEGYIHFASQNSFASANERDVIVDLFERCVVAMGERPHPAGETLYTPSRVMFTEHAKAQLAAYDC